MFPNTAVDGIPKRYPVPILSRGFVGFPMSVIAAKPEVPPLYNISVLRTPVNGINKLPAFPPDPATDVAAPFMLMSPPEPAPPVLGVLRPPVAET